MSQQEKVLHRLRMAIQTKISPQDFERLNFDSQLAYDGIAVKIIKELYGERRTESVPVIFQFKKPSTWWQHFKEANFPKWLLEKFPVKYTIETQQRVVALDRTWEFPNAYVPESKILNKYVVHDSHMVWPETLSVTSIKD